MLEIKVKGRDGATMQSMEASVGMPLMEVLRDGGAGVVGTCGGACACGTCHVYIAKPWLDQIPPRTEDEQMMLEAIGELVQVREDSRLSCQITMTAALAGMEVEVGPVA